MKTIAIFILICIFFLFYRKENFSKCDPFLETTKLIDTLEVEVELLNLVKLPINHPPLDYLNKKRLIDKTQFKSSIIFKINDCSTRFNEVISANSDRSREILNSDYPQKAIIKCVVFKDQGIPNLSKEGYFISVIDVRK